MGLTPAPAPPVLSARSSEITVLKYLKLEFQDQWEWNYDTYSFRPVHRTAVLLVVTEVTGGLQTHWFKVRRRPETPGGVYWHENVYVPRENNIVYVPERCVARRPGDHTTCGETPETSPEVPPAPNTAPRASIVRRRRRAR